MKREIKSRVWDEIDKKMYYAGKCKLSIDLFGYIYDDESTEPTTSMNHRMKLLRGTGLKDKNGVEIYEGDILSLSRCNPKEYKVGFIEGAFCLCFINGIWKNHYALDMNYIQRSLKKKSEVIGNIYENPELVDNSD